jgi:hypothetical protein
MNSAASQALEMPRVASLERHFSVSDVGEAWGLSADTVRRLFEHEPGVLVIEPPASRFSKRRYRTLRIPESVAERVHRRMSVVNEREKR